MTDSFDSSSLVARYLPALRKLALVRRRGRVPFVQQTAATDCGAACLAMTLALHGRSVSVDDVRDAIGLSRHGTDALTMVEASRFFGLRGRAVKVREVDHLRYLEAGTILHWRFNHYVVLEGLDRRGVWIVDPAHGRRLISWGDLNTSFTGVAMTFVKGEDFEPQGARKSAIWHYLRQLKEHSRLLVRIVVTSIFIQLLTLSVPVLTGLIVDRVVPRGDLDLLKVLAVGAAGVVGFKLLSLLIRSFMLLFLRTRLDVRMSLRFLDHLVELPYLFFQQRSTGDLLMRLNSNSTIREILTSGAISAIFDGTMVTLYLALLLAANLKIGLLVALLAALQLTIFLITRRRQRDLMTESLQAQADARSYEVQLLAGIETVKSSGFEHRAVEHWSHLFVREVNVSLDRGRLEAVVNSLLDSLATASPLVVLIYGTSLVLSGELSLGTMLALNSLAQGFLSPVGALVGTAFQMQLLGGYLERLNDVFEAPREHEDTEGHPAPTLRGKIRLDEVTFRYALMIPPAVREVSLEIENGQMVAIVGHSGSGKSTLAGLLAGLYRPESGRIFYDEANIAEMDLRTLRSQLGFVTQHPYLFGASIRSNLSQNNPNIPLSRIFEACKLAAIHEDVIAMPMGYETVLADSGASLSGGQRQRLALARALVRQPKVLILDEATSSLDAVTEAQIQRHLAGLKSTRIVIAHRLSTIRDADLILVMDQGAIVERGSHDELIALGGKYQELVAAQLDKKRRRS